MGLNHGIKIIGTGCYRPELTVKNSDFTKFIETSDEWIFSRTGISERRFNIGKTNFFMAAKAAENALCSAEVSAEEIDMIVVSTGSPDFFYPNCACLVQSNIGAKNACAVDISAACTGFITALDMARSYLAVGKYKKILVISSEFLSRQVDFTDRGTCVLFGDGAGAVVAQTSDKTYASFLGAQGDSDMNLYCAVNYDSNTPFGDYTAEVKPNYIQMNGKDVYKFATDIMPRAVEVACREAGFSLSDLDLLIPHQANIRIINTAVKSLGLPSEKVYININKTGNISSACIPTCLDELNCVGKLKSGMKICMVAFGAGLTYGAIAFES